MIGRVDCVGGGVVAYLYGVVRVFVNGDGDILFIMPDGVKLKYIDKFTIAETWLYDIHFLGFDLSGWLVFDIGAYVGDTALYYAKRGAAVVAVEPVPANFEAMLKNIELNPEIGHRILPINAAVADADGFVEIYHSGPLDGAASIFDRKGTVARVRSMKLRTLIEEAAKNGINLEAFRVRVLKMDCKGCEWDVVNSEGDVLKLFDIVKIEYSGYLRNYTVDELKSRVEALGFRCRVWAHNDVAIRLGLDRHGTLTYFKEGFTYAV